MSETTLLWVIILCGAGTFLIRFLPLRWQDKGAGKGVMKGRLRHALDAIGPSAIVALLVTSFWSMVDMAAFTYDTLAIILGLLGVCAGKKILGSIAWATLAGVCAYGATLYGSSLLF